jgi:hypothetical protein
MQTRKSPLIPSTSGDGNGKSGRTVRYAQMPFVDPFNGTFQWLPLLIPDHFRTDSFCFRKFDA